MLKKGSKVCFKNDDGYIFNKGFTHKDIYGVVVEIISKKLVNLKLYLKLNNKAVSLGSRCDLVWIFNEKALKPNHNLKLKKAKVTKR